MPAHIAAATAASVRPSMTISITLVTRSSSSVFAASGVSAGQNASLVEAISAGYLLPTLEPERTTPPGKGMITPGTARIAAERLCRVVGETPVLLPGDAGAVQVTISVGLALGPTLAPDTGENAARDAFARADAALLASKAEGRNQVTISSAA